MKTWCVAVVVLSLISVCQAASLTCQKLMKPVDKTQDISGTWHFIAVSTKYCWISTIINVFFWPSIAVDVTAKDTPNIYDTNMKFKLYGKCVNDSTSLHYENHSLSKADRNNAPIGETNVLLQTGCSDCVVVKVVDIITILGLFSRRKSVDAAELKEFETQAQCLGWTKPLVLDTDHDDENCTSVDDPQLNVKVGTTILTKMSDRVESMYHTLNECFTDTVLAYFSTSK